MTKKTEFPVHEAPPTQEELLARCAERKGSDPFGWEIIHYADYLTPESMAALLGKPLTAPHTANPWSRAAILTEMQEYLSFAFDKANDQRGLSANRSIAHYIAWTWLSGDRALSASVEREYDAEYCYYGKPILRRIAEHYGWDWSKLDDGELSNGGE